MDATVTGHTVFTASSAKTCLFPDFGVLVALLELWVRVRPLC